MRQMVGQSCSVRYTTQQFEPQSALNVVYGSAEELTAIYVSEEVTVEVDLTMDVYQPMGDNLQTRPCVILAYGGGWIFGSKEDEDISSTCDSLARKSYVAVSINYRMGLNVADAETMERAVYRGAQDFSAAVRFLKENATSYGIDPEYMFVGGVSAGGFGALHMAYMDEDERPESTFGGGWLGLWPDLGCLDCSGNNFNHSHDVRGIINLWGAILDNDMIDAEQALPQVSFHGTIDEIVPYNSGSPFGATLLAPNVEGSALIHEHLVSLGISSELNTFEDVGHNIWGVNVLNELTPGPTEHWQPITDSIGSWLYEQIRPEAPNLILPDQPFGLVPVTLQIDNVPEGGHACWFVEGGSIQAANTDSSEVVVLWSEIGTYTIQVAQENHLKAASLSVQEYIDVELDNTINELTDGQFVAYYEAFDLAGRKLGSASLWEGLHKVVGNKPCIIMSRNLEGEIVSKNKYVQLPASPVAQ